MNTGIRALIFAGVCLGAVSTPVQAQKAAGDLTVVVTGMESNRGRVYIGLVQSKKNFLSKKQGKLFRGAVRSVKNKRVVYVFRGIPAGSYAIQVYHDENGNGKMDTNFLGIPKESVGFSNKARARFGPPSYEKARFQFKGGKGTHRIRVR